jgi:hypothetical protein
MDGFEEKKPLLRSTHGKYAVCAGLQGAIHGAGPCRAYLACRRVRAEHSRMTTKLRKAF